MDMPMKTARIWVVLLLVPWFAGCETVLRGSRQTLNFQTDPPDAQVSVDGHIYKSPVGISLQRKVEHHVVVEKAGYHTVTFTIHPQWDGISVVGDVIVPGGSVGFAVDKASGADMFFYKLPKISLSPTTQPMPALRLYDYQGRLLTAEQLAKAAAFDSRDRAQFFRGQP
jgi:PEGA domain